MHWAIVLTLMLLAAVASVAAANDVTDAAAATTPATGTVPLRSQQRQRLPAGSAIASHSLYREIPYLKLYKACGVPLVMLLTRKCSSRGGVYQLRKDPRFTYMFDREKQNKTSTPAALPMLSSSRLGLRLLCFRRNFGLRNPFVDCCCNYCTEDTVLKYCREPVRQHGFDRGTWQLPASPDGELPPLPTDDWAG